MIEFSNGGCIVQRLEELPDPRGCSLLYEDFETRSGDPKRGGDSPWNGDRICGIALTWDDHPRAYYVPIRHAHAWWNLPLENVLRWHADVLKSAKQWVNHNILFDVAFARVDGADFGGELFDTLTFAKMIESDRGFGDGGYGLDALSASWLDRDISGLDQRLQAYLQAEKTKDYADAPADILGEYACEDVLTNRMLHRHILKRAERQWAEVPRSRDLWAMEQRLTPVLADMERDGLRVDRTELRIREYQVSARAVRLQEEIHKLVGYPLEPGSSKDCHELLVNRLGLPVLAWTEPEFYEDGSIKKPSGPSFTQDALKLYLGHPEVATSEALSAAVRKIIECRGRLTQLSLFIRPLQELCDDRGFVHPHYNQLVRTGRMSCSKPNGQQQDDESKTLFHPDSADDAFLRCDASQIEFRIIGHYCNDESVVGAYRRDPDTDFHMWIAEMCRTSRSPAKTINFTVGYGGSKKRVMQGLSSNPEIMAEMREASLGDPVKYAALCLQRAEEVYDAYHRTLPSLKPVTRRAARLAEGTGYVFNGCGRKRSLPIKAAWRAFNSICQGMASDLVKYGMVALSPRYCSWTRERGISVRINVHDEVAFHGPREAFDEPTSGALVRRLETVPVPLRVPIRFGCELATRSWGESEKMELQKDRGVYSIIP